VSERRELVVIGAGPAGMRAALAARRHGADVLVLDERSAPGGQIWRDVESPALGDPGRLGADYAEGARRVARFRACGVAYRPGTLVWDLTPARRLHLAGGDGPRTVDAGHVVIATGAIERPFPAPGWTLPGVIAAGGAQALLKGAALVPQGPVVLAGTGALLLLLAAQYLRLGVAPAAILETTPAGALGRHVGSLPGAITAGNYLSKGLGMLRAIRRAGVRHLRGVEALRAEGGARLERVTWRVAGRESALEARTLLLHQGVVPDVNLTMALACAHRWDPGQLCFRPCTDAWGATDLDGVAVAGDGAGISGAISAGHAGELAGLDAAHRLGYLDRVRRDRLGKGARAALSRSLRVRPFLEALHRPRHGDRVPTDDDVVVCRCEEVRAGTVRAAIAGGALDPNAVKSRTRCGMGPCQGRYCGLTVTEMLAAARGQEPGAVGYFRIRPPIKAVPINDLMALQSAAPPPEAALPDTGRPGKAPA
jgi:NADPH-dependent 2,4-dienoyl-CoA reductase/sulfur reductase-like enzyme